MTNFNFPSRWLPQNPNRLQLYSLNTPNGQKVSLCLEEMGLEYDAHLIHIGKGDQHDPEYRFINPNGKIPSLIDPKGPGGKPIALMESIVILIYLAELSGTLLPTVARNRFEHLQWLSFQAAHIGPMFGQFGHFYVYAKHKTSDTYSLDRYTQETRRLLQVLNERLQDREFFMGDYSIVDIAIMPWVDCLSSYYQASELLGISDFDRVQAWHESICRRKAWQIGKDICAP
jgi:GST-like protein